MKKLTHPDVDKAIFAAMTEMNQKRLASPVDGRAALQKLLSAKPQPAPEMMNEPAPEMMNGIQQ